MTSVRRITSLAAGLMAAIAISGGPAFAAGDTQAAWEGYATNTASTAACATVGGTGKADTHVSIFRPHINVADTPTFLSMMHLRAAITFQNSNEATIHQMKGAGNYSAFGVNSRGKGFTYTGTYNLSVSPNPVISTTQVINVTGSLTNYFNTAGCTVTFKAVYVKRID
jgi:hypothetical protein